MAGGSGVFGQLKVNIELSIATIFALVACGAGGMLALVLLGARNQRTIWLAAFVGTFSFSLLTGFFGGLSDSQAWAWVAQLLPALNFLAMPFLYFYAAAAVGQPAAKKELHCLPAAIAAIVLAAYADLNRTHLYWMLVLQSVLYLAYVLIQISRYRRQIREQYSSLSHIDFMWLQTMVVALLLLGVFDIIVFPVARQFWITPAAAQSAFNFLGTLYLFWMAQGAISQEFVELDPKLEAANSSYEKSGLDSDSANALASEIQKIMDSQRLHLQPDLSLSRLAEAVGITSHIASEVLNQTIGQSFYDFVNQRRISTAKSLLTESENSILEIAFMSGFNNKVSFNKAFRRFEATTPGEYRRSNRCAKK